MVFVVRFSSTNENAATTQRAVVQEPSSLLVSCDGRSKNPPD